MKKKAVITGFISILALLAVLLPKWKSLQELDSAKNNKTQSFHTTEKDEKKQSLNSIAESIKNLGKIGKPPSITELQKSVANGDVSLIRRAFGRAPYERFTKREELLPALKEYLLSDSPLARMLAAQALYVIGDTSGATTLINLVKSPPTGNEEDEKLRIESAIILAKYREQSAGDAVLQLYRDTEGGGLLSALAKLKRNEVATVLKRENYRGSQQSIELYGKLRANQFLNPISDTYSRTKDAEARAASAWALAQMTGDEQYVDSLIDQSQQAIDAPVKNGILNYDASSLALMYLGSIKSEKAKATLERALESRNPVAVQYATVNLIFNQGRSKKAEELIVRELRGEQNMLSMDLLLSLATKVSGAEILAAGEEYNRRTYENAWQIYHTKRRDWPIYNWIDDYVVELNP